jgi:predicted outer membrane repeat protein
MGRSSVHRFASSVLAASLLTLATAASQARATDFTVNDTTDAPLAASSGTTCASTDNGGCTLRAAIQAANKTPGGTNTIKLPAGHFKLTVAPTGTTAGSDPNDAAHGDLDVLTNDSVTITGAGSSATTIDANEIDRAFSVQHGGSLTLSKLTIENGFAAVQSSGARDGGAIDSAGALALTSDVMLQNNSTVGTASGGAVAVEPTATGFSASGATFDGNGAPNGGAILFNAVGVPLTVTGSTFADNQAVGVAGGAIDDENSGAFTVTDSTFDGNNAVTNGGAIYMDAIAAFSVTGGTFDHNIGGIGSAIRDDTSTSEEIASTTFSANTATSSATLYIINGISASNTLTNVTFDGNHGASIAGAIADEGGKLTLISSSLTGNRAGMAGGLLAASAGALTLTNTTISGNHATVGGGLYFTDTPPVSLTNDTIAFNTAIQPDGGGIASAQSASTGGAGVTNTIVADNTGGDCGYGADSHFLASVDSGHNLDGDGSCFGGLGGTGDKTSVDPLLSPAAANGGPVETDALGTGSPAIDAASAGACPATDARGVARPQGAGCDLGAFEASTPNATITSPTNHATFTQGTVVTAAYSCSEAALRSLIASCTGNVAQGAAIDTSTPGSHTFTVTAIDDQGLLATAAVQYTVTLPPPPNTKITRHHVSGDTVTIAFKGIGGAGALTFRCKLGKHGTYRRCTSPKAYSGLSKGQHTVQIRAVDAASQSDPTPATLRFRIRRR